MLLLQLNSPTAVMQAGSLRNPGSFIHGSLFASVKTENGATIGIDALSGTLIEIDDLRNCYLNRGHEDTPTEVAHSCAKILLSKAQTFAPIYIAASTIEASEGDLLIHWDTFDKSVVLICPAVSTKTPQLYTEELANKKATHSTMMEATPQLLSEALTWVLQPK